MQWPGIIRQGLSPTLAIGVIAASIFTAVTSNPGTSPANGSAAQQYDNAQVSALWSAGAAKVAAPVQISHLSEIGDTTGGAWIETYYAPATVGRVYGKLVVTREFGPSDEVDADTIINQPQAHLVAVSMGFKASTGDSKSWFRARFAPDGTVLNTTGQLPSSIEMAALANAHCSAPLSQEIAASG